MCLISETSTVTHDFFVLLARDNLYRIAWQVSKKVCVGKFWARMSLRLSVLVDRKYLLGILLIFLIVSIVYLFISV